MYIDSSTFWIVSLALLGAICAVYYVHNDKIKKLSGAEPSDIIKDIVAAVDQNAKNLEVLKASLIKLTEFHEEDIKEVTAKTFTPQQIEEIVKKVIDKKHANRQD